MKYDVGIIGGGLAGLSTALHACPELDIVIVDKGRIGDPKKTSPFTFPDVVEKYSLDEAVLQKYTRFTYRSPNGVSATFEYDEPAFVTLDYEKTCETMLHRIKKKGNVEVLENTEVTSFRIDKGFFRTRNLKLCLSNSGNILVDVLVDASGKSLFTATRLRLKLPSFYSHPYGELLERCEIENPQEMCIFAGKEYGNGGGWFYPLDKTTTRFGFATVTRSPNYPLTLVKQNFVEACNNFRPYNEMVKNARKVRSELGTIPLGPLRRFVFKRILIVGDAAGQATPWYCEGVRPALDGGELCGETLSKAYRQKTYSARTLKEYQKAWDRRNRKTYSKTTKIGFWSWFRSQGEWDTAVRYVASLTPEQMIKRVRYSKP